jgi:hypothetical protein
VHHKILFGKFHFTLGQIILPFVTFVHLNFPSLLPTQIENESASMLKNLVAEVFNSVLFKDTIFLHNFLGNYQSFTTTNQVLDMLFTW